MSPPVVVLRRVAFLQLGELAVCEVEVEGCSGVLQVFRIRCADDRARDDRLGQHPRECNLRHRDIACVGDVLDGDDSPLLAPTLAAACTQVGPMPEGPTVHLDAAYDSGPTRELLTELGFDADTARKGIPAPIQAGRRWVVERTNSWMNGYGKLRRCTDRNGLIIDFFLYLAAAFVILRRLIQRARSRYRWPTRPTTKRLK